MLVDKETSEESILFGADTIQVARERMIEWVSANEINTEKLFCYLKKVYFYVK